MLAILIAAILAAPSTPVERLTAYIVKRQPKAQPYALVLARSILRESKRVQIDPAVMVAVAWVESRFDVRAKGSAQEQGLYQLMRSDYRMAASWARLHPTEPPWGKLSREAITRALRDVVTSTYLAADELAAVMAWCRKAGHRIGRGAPPIWILGIDGVHRIHSRRQYHTRSIDRVGHHQSGARMPLPGYIRALRHAYKRAKAVIRE